MTVCLHYLLQNLRSLRLKGCTSRKVFPHLNLHRTQVYYRKWRVILQSQSQALIRRSLHCLELRSLQTE